MAPMKFETLGRYNRIANDLGYKAAAEALGITRETLRRRVREYKNIVEKNRIESDSVNEKLLKQISERFSEVELKRLIKSSSISFTSDKTTYNFDGEELTFGVLTDTHLGSVFTNPNFLREAFNVFASSGVNFIVHAGDVTEGLSNRAGHMYECTHIGYSAQLDHAREIFSEWTQCPIYAVDGNHDRWYIKSNGAKIVEEIDRSLDNFHFIGHDEGDIVVVKNKNKVELETNSKNARGIKIKVWHGEDSSSYAFSYRIQKIVESLTGGEKPNVLICGHTHKSLYVYDRHIHCLSAGAIQKQSRWMRSKRQASHTGFWVCKMSIDYTGVSWFASRFYPFYQ